MGRWKMGPQGGYWDGADSGPDQFTPSPAQQAQQAGPQAQPMQPPTQPMPMGGQPPMAGDPNGGMATNCWGPGGATNCWGSPFALAPGGPGQWHVNGSGPQSIADLLQQLQGGLRKPGGETMPGTAQPLTQGRPGGMAGAAMGSMGGGGVSLGSLGKGMLGGLFGR